MCLFAPIVALFLMYHFYIHNFPFLSFIFPTILCILLVLIEDRHKRKGNAKDLTTSERWEETLDKYIAIIFSNKS